MAYFANGTEGMNYEAQYCDNCSHFFDEDGETYACTVLKLHYDFNYQQGGKTKLGKAIKQVLETLIPTQENGLWADKCTMFHDKAERPDSYLTKLQDGLSPMEAMQ